MISAAAKADKMQAVMQQAGDCGVPSAISLKGGITMVQSSRVPILAIDFDDLDECCAKLTELSRLAPSSCREICDQILISHLAAKLLQPAS